MSILRYIAAQPGGLCSLSQLYAVFPRERVDNDLLKLYAVGYVVSDGQSCRITPVGLNALALSERRKERRAQQEREKEHQAAQRKKDKQKQFRHDFFVACLATATGAILTGIIEHFAEIVMFIKELFGK